MKSRIKYVSALGSIFFILLFLFRIAFVTLYRPEAHQLGLLESLHAFLIGFRFDIATVIYLLIIPIVFILSPLCNVYLHKSINIFCFIAFYSLTGILTADLIYYAQSNKKIGFEALIIVQNFKNIAYMAASSYRWSIFIFLLLGFIGYFYWNRFFSRLILAVCRNTIPATKFFILLPIVLVCGIIGARGGLQSRPLKPIMAFQDENMYLGYMALNGFYTSMTSLYKQDSLPVFKYDNDKINDRIRKLLGAKNEVFLDSEYPFYRKLNSKKPNKKYNVVIIIMESWGYLDLGRSGNSVDPTPFFDRLSKKGLFFKKHFSVASRTISVIPSVLSSIPTLFGKVYTTSSYQYNKQRGIATLFKELGYESFLIYSATSGSMGFSTYAPIAGFQKIITKDDFDTNKIPTDGVWGVYDQYSFQRLHHELNQSKGHVLGVIKTIHPHLPFTLPEGKVFLEKDIDNFEFYNDMRYTDWCLEKFFEKAEKSHYFKNTLFVILGDHAHGQKPGIEIFHTPLLFYAPSLIQKGHESNRIASQLDILPTILDLLNINRPHASFGKSLLSDAPEWALVDFDNFIGWVNQDHILLSSQEKVIGLYRYEKDPGLSKNLLKSENNETQRIKEILEQDWQYFMSGIANTIMRNKIAP